MKNTKVDGVVLIVVKKCGGENKEKLTTINVEKFPERRGESHGSVRSRVSGKLFVGRNIKGVLKVASGFGDGRTESGRRPADFTEGFTGGGQGDMVGRPSVCVGGGIFDWIERRGEGKDKKEGYLRCGSSGGANSYAGVTTDNGISFVAGGKLCGGAVKELLQNKELVQSKVQASFEREGGEWSRTRVDKIQ